uniref:(California timema) hypothetical protein n=1 Tax=Timema californicum TaxID=61474 RepID=A0A7R9J4D5_TIMCA|nr:unnamed protein product [Timema californicum]
MEIEDYDEEKLPSHPCLKLVANSEQILSTYTSRRLITLEKLQEPEEQQCPITTETSTEQFRAKFFKFGEELRRQRKERRALELEAYRASVREKNTFTSPHYETTSAINCCETTQEEQTDTVTDWWRERWVRHIRKRREPISGTTLLMAWVKINISLVSSEDQLTLLSPKHGGSTQVVKAITPGTKLRL